MKRIVKVIVIMTILAALARLSVEVESVQNFMLAGVAGAFVQNAIEPAAESSGNLRVFVCGSASPLGRTDRAQACIAVLTPEHFFLIDSGAGSTDNLGAGRLPMVRLDGLLLTHFHSDHIAELYEVNLASWIQGRPVPLKVIGPVGVDRIVDSVNQGYAMDRDYRTSHHGEAMLPTQLGVLQAETVTEGIILEQGHMTITLYTGSHAPIDPAVGYRFDYKGRSVVVSGDSLVTNETRRIADGADLLLHDALSEPIVSALSESASEAGLSRVSKIMADVMDYHASTTSLIELSDQIDVGGIALYHLVPAPVNWFVEKIFERGLPANYVITDDGMWFDLPLQSDEIIITSP